MKAFLGALVAAGAAQAARRELWLNGATGATMVTRGFVPPSNVGNVYNPGQPDAACPAGTIAALATTPYLCAATNLLGPLTAAGVTLPSTYPSLTPWQTQQAALASAILLGSGQGYLISGMRLFDTVAAVQTAMCASSQTANGATGAYCQGGQMNTTLYSALPLAAQKNVSVTFGAAVCSLLLPILSNGAACAPTTCMNTTWNTCDGDNSTDGYGSIIAAGVNGMSSAAVAACLMGGMPPSGKSVGTAYKCEDLIPAAKFGTYVVPPTAAPGSGNHTNTSSPVSPASSVEMGLLAAASLVVAALTM